MKSHWILLIAFTFAFLSQADSKTYGLSKDEDDFGALPLESGGTEGSLVSGQFQGKSRYIPQRGREKVQSNTKDGDISNKMKITSKIIGAGKSPFAKMVHLLHSLPVASQDNSGHTRTKMSTREKRAEKVDKPDDEGFQQEPWADVFLTPFERKSVHLLEKEPEFAYGETKLLSPVSDVSSNHKVNVKGVPMGKHKLGLNNFGSGETQEYDEDDEQLSVGDTSGLIEFEDETNSDSVERVFSGEEQFASTHKENDYPGRKRAAPEYKSARHQAKTKKNRNKAFTLPISGGLRWKGLSMAHVRSRDGVVARESRATREQGKWDGDGVATTLTVVFILGGSTFVLLMGIILLFAIWPVRKYFQYLLSRTEEEDVKTGRCGNELSSIRIDRSYPSERTSDSTSTPQGLQCGQLAEQFYPTPGDQSSGIPLDTQAKKYPDQSQRRLMESIVAEDKIRDSRNAESGNELSSIRIDRSYPSERTSDSASTPQGLHCGQLAEQFYQTPGDQSSGIPLDTQPKKYLDQSQMRLKESIVAEDKIRDSRNAERRKIIQRQTFKKRGSLADNLLVAKEIIDGFGKNKEFEKKASERRRKIKESSGQRKRRKSFVEEVQSACSVITPNWDKNEKMVQSKDNRRRIKNRMDKSRRTSVLDQIQVAKDVIVGDEKEH